MVGSANRNYRERCMLLTEKVQVIGDLLWVEQGYASVALLGHREHRPRPMAWTKLDVRKGSNPCGVGAVDTTGLLSQEAKRLQEVWRKPLLGNRMAYD